MGPLDESILQSVKLSLGIPVEYEYFDRQILMHLNSIMAVLYQLGVGPEDGFYVTDESVIWRDLLSDAETQKKFLYVQSYVCLRVRLLFDPPTSSGAIDAMERQMRELEWRITVTEDPVDESEEVENEPSE